jgi:micrococcal nuclease
MLFLKEKILIIACAFMFLHSCINTDRKEKASEAKIKSGIDSLPTYQVTQVADGDTYEVIIADTVTRIRINGIDAPERYMPYSIISRNFLNSKIYRKNVHVKFLQKDIHNRWVADTYLDTLNIGALMIQEGMAWHFKNFSKDQQLSDLELAARKNKVGLWKDSMPTPPWEWRKEKRALKKNQSPQILIQ